MARALPALVDLIAERLLGLRLVSGTQWLLRGVAALAMTAALVLTLPDGLFAHAGAGALTVVAGIGVLIQSIRPDLDIGMLPPLAVILALAGQPDLSVPRGLAVGFALLAAHMAWALAATIPAHGSFSAAAWALTGRAALLALVASLLGSTVVIVLSGVRLGPWMIVAGVLAVIGLCAAILPRDR
ncbi:hypothetical protein FM106_17285 [Brachybacterium faecium]|uniref:Uncharacterized protein n=1 Tax=Brachybacterium faecium (strain ATCC 43885 / DSM 4810 / JCM 11609 / LMG 19847 / NBRC 14762 / NCIMB 9860 / 6-10) TaxID=446465 RepID=C7MAD7_BRAFD|nr:hypothetical protein [Brachybacterium faecium]ACU84695.1 hypothetical protein Bfae_08410 [Brachybacterium faecium DSM 4810]SLM99384.1 hypothetical protein FM106_17285 [Brachybacterium faecium]HJG53478.1 hypothetical protein [Brachybacterium faecium]